MTAFPLKCGSLAARANGAEGVRESVAGLSGHSLTAKGGNRGCWSGCLGGGSAGDQTDRRASTFSLIDLGIGKTVGLGTIGPHIGTIGPNDDNPTSTSFRSIPVTVWVECGGTSGTIALVGLMSLCHILYSGTGIDAMNAKHKILNLWTLI